MCDFPLSYKSRIYFIVLQFLLQTEHFLRRIPDHPDKRGFHRQFGKQNAVCKRTKPDRNSQDLCFGHWFRI